jgi:hypothetical protein
MLKVQQRRRMQRQLGSKSDLFDRVGQSTYNEAVGQVCKLLSSIVKAKKEELTSELRNDFGNEGLASAKPYMSDWVTYIMDKILCDGYQPILDAVKQQVIEPNDLEEVSAMSRFKNLLAVACEAHKRGEKEIGMQIFAEAMDSFDVDEAIEQLDLEVPEPEPEPEAEPVAEDKCASCGKSCPEGSNFCCGCGAKIEKEEPAAEPEAVPVEAKTVITAEARKKIVAIANDMASRDGGKYKSLARELLIATRPE